MATLIALRHGQSTANADGILAGRTPGVALDDIGRRQADEAGARVTDVGLAAAVRSPILRCEQTLDRALAAAGSPLAPSVDERFIECDYGQWTGRPLTELAQEGCWADLQHHPTSIVFPEGESMASMFARVSHGVRDWNQRVGDGVWLLVSHGDPIKAIVAEAMGLALDQFQRIVINPGALCVISYPADGFPMVNGVNLTAGHVRCHLGSSQAQVGGGIGAGV